MNFVLDVKQIMKYCVLLVFILALLSICYLVGDKLKKQVTQIIKSQPVVWSNPISKIKTVQLKNGMKIVVLQDNSKPKVLMQVAYDVGSSAENSYERGLAHLIEHMIFKGTEKLTESDIPAIAKKYGASCNAYTSKDITSYYFEVNRTDWKPFIDVLADCMKNARFDEQHLASELRAVVQELNRNRDNHGRTMVEKACSLLYPSNHPYHFPTIGFKEELANVSAAELKDFYKRHYQPEKAALFIIGDIDPEEAIKLATANFESIVSEQPEDVYEPSFPPLTNNLDEINFSFYQDVQKEELCFFWEIPGEDKAVKAEWHFLAKYLCNSKNAVLKTKLVDKEMVADDINIGFWQFKKSGLAFIFVTPKKGMAAECENLIKSELVKIAKKGISQIEIEQRVPVLAKSFIEGLQDFQTIAYLWSSYYFAKNDLLGFFNYVEELNSMSPEKLSFLIKEYFVKQGLKKVSLLPLTEDKKSVWSSNAKIVKEQENKILANHIRTTLIEEPKAVYELADPVFESHQFPEPTEVCEINNLRTIFHVKQNLPLVHLRLAFKNHQYNALDLNNLATIVMMQMLFEGSVGMSKQEIYDYFDSMGASVSVDESGEVSLSCLSSSFSVVLQKLFFILKNPLFKRNAFEKLKNILISGIEQRQDSPTALVSNRFTQHVFKNTELAYSFQDQIKFLKELTLRQISFVFEELNPKNCILGISGNIDLVEIKELLEKLTKNWQQKSAEFVKKELPKLNAEEALEENIHLLRDQTMVFFGGVTNLSRLDPEYPLLELATVMAFRSFGSRFFKIREQTGLFYGISGTFAGRMSTLVNQFYIATQLNPGKLEEGEALILQALQSIIDSGFSEEELITAKTYVQNILIDLVYSPAGAIRTFLTLDIFNLPLDFYDKYWKTITSCNAEQVSLAVKKFLSKAKLSKIRVGNFR